MDEKLIKVLNGFSGSQVLLIKDNEKTFVRKIGNIERNYERINYLSQRGFCLPKIHRKLENQLDIEYISSLDIKTYLEYNSIQNLCDFLINTIKKLSKNKKEKCYKDVFEAKLNEINFDRLPFSKQKLLDKLPKTTFSSDYFGDLTLENVLYSSNKGFVLIDPATIEYDSYIFDIAKLRQDLKCKWFLRKSKNKLDIQLNEIERRILEEFPEANNDLFLILMLMRVYKHTTKGTEEETFLLDNITKIWNNT